MSDVPGGPGKVRCRRAVTGDLDGLGLLDAACFPETERWSMSAWRAELDDGVDRAVWVAVRPQAGAEDGCQVFEQVVAACCFRAVDQDAELFRVMTDPGLRGLGLGTVLLTAGLAWARDRGAARALLEVRHDNVTARSLYVDLGFADLYRRTNYYGPGADAVVMVRALEGLPGPVSGNSGCDKEERSEGRRS
ncbi:MAG: GNAT family N-acetyltransferase [Actinomycetia bacterium]|nr:GNAT family N-acetyltransferase [Actinomycetes bacterium]